MSMALQIAGTTSDTSLPQQRAINLRGFEATYFILVLLQLKLKQLLLNCNTFSRFYLTESKALLAQSSNHTMWINEETQGLPPDNLNLFKHRLNRHQGSC